MGNEEQRFSTVTTSNSFYNASIYQLSDFQDTINYNLICGEPHKQYSASLLDVIFGSGQPDLASWRNFRMQSTNVSFFGNFTSFGDCIYASATELRTNILNSSSLYESPSSSMKASVTVVSMNELQEDGDIVPVDALTEADQFNVYYPKIDIPIGYEGLCAVWNETLLLWSQSCEYSETQAESVCTCQQAGYYTLFIREKANIDPDDQRLSKDDSNDTTTIIVAVVVSVGGAAMLVLGAYYGRSYLRSTRQEYNAQNLNNIPQFLIYNPYANDWVVTVVDKDHVFN
eukprot:TRINITY_DN3830_c0_g1_i1.p1 TRINITY_DN3830_c0_g1~~TRINITY_DN3830_c0_g1_i1.p1  ORF type:complete len:286 (-),score=53.86 TRINITY_DN3830_c0_g1_i1:125-982(-)